MFIMIDNYDSFVYNLVRYFQELEEDVYTVRNDKITISDIENLKPMGIIISPGPKSPLESGICLEILEHFKGKIPILGICLGHQCIGHFFGGSVVKGKEPVHGKLSSVTHDNKGIFKGIPNLFTVTRYHSLIVEKDNISEDLEISAVTSDGVVMGVRHKKYLIEGVQFHPEAELTEHGHQLLKNFIDLCKNDGGNL
ncbi:MAG: aminodeoxychorismate/anthranilate synthase component II [Fusobacteriaceae bacterium]|nr:aminodeoxychorismate/anthranilate synthase component II [Fusobacteriaceae bacterium]MBP6323342.1 aminodeoxychorismate/anthranilate synthase component II [Fusobacteriaceae bacterium]MBP9510307.1 aminodeoxychorismate/anthranilate synthase component II [Fusobacteriaceae bacterium]